MADLTGKRIGKLVAVQKVAGKGVSWWSCQCDCGKIKKVRAYVLKTGLISSCGCSRIKHGKSKTKAYAMFTSARLRAERDGLEFSIELDDVVIPEICPVLGVELIGSGTRQSGPKPNSPTLDRINPKKGYVKGNVWVISHRANFLKSNGTLEEIMALSKALRKVIHG